MQAKTVSPAIKASDKNYKRNIQPGLLQITQQLLQVYLQFLTTHQQPISKCMYITFISGCLLHNISFALLNIHQLSRFYQTNKFNLKLLTCFYLAPPLPCLYFVPPFPCMYQYTFSLLAFGSTISLLFLVCFEKQNVVSP